MGNEKEKSLALAIGLNFLLPGLGYMYMGKWIVGIFACLLIFGIYLMSFLLIIPAWIGMNIIMAIDMVILSNKNKQKFAEENTKKCPSCAETIQKEAKVCRFCGAKVEAELNVPVELDEQEREKLAKELIDKKIERQLLESYSMGQQLSDDEVDFLRNRGVSV